MSTAPPSPATPPKPKKKRSTIKTIIYVIILLVALSLILQALGFGVVHQAERDEMIERPHTE